MTTDPKRATTEPGGVEVVRLSSLAEIRNIDGAWDALVEADPHARLYQSRQVFFAWQEAAESPDEPWFLLAKVDGEPVGLAPLVRRSMSRRGLRFRVLTFGQPRGDCVIARRREDVAAAFWDYLRQRTRDWDVLAFDDVPAAPGTIAALARELGPRAGYRWGDTEPAPSETYLDASTTWEQYLGTKGAHFRKRLKPYCARIERLGAVSYRRHLGPDEASAAFEEFMGLEEHSWKATSGTPLSRQERGCFRALVRDRTGSICPDILFLEVDGRPVSAILSLTFKRCYYLFVTFFDERLRDLQPGRPVIREALRYAFAREDINEISFVGSYSSATSWSDQVREYRKVQVYGSGLRGKLAQTVDRWNARAEPKLGDGSRDD